MAGNNDALSALPVIPRIVDASFAYPCHSHDVIAKRWPLGVFALALGTVLAIAPVMAHQPVDLDQGDSSPARGPLLVDGTVSFAVNADVARGDRRGFRFDLDNGDTMAIQLLIRDTPPGNRLAASQMPRVTVTDPRGRKTRMVINERTEFYEPYGGNTYFYLSRMEKEAVPGTYRVRISGRSERPVQTVVAVGYREVPGQVQNRSSNVTLSTLHAIPANRGGRAVDVYADETLVAEGLSRSELTTTKLKAGTYDIVVVPEGVTRFTKDPILRADDVSLGAGDNHTLALHLSPTGQVTSTVFDNETRTVGRDMGRMTFRHIAAAPRVDVRTRGSVLMQGVRGGQEADKGVRSGNYKVRIVKEGTRQKMVPTSTHSMENAPGRQDMGDNRIIYLWGSEDDESLSLAVQEIPLDLR